VADPRCRTISPFSKLTVPVWIENRIKEGTLESLRSAIQMDPANARLIVYFGLALANLALAERSDPGDARRARAEADFQTASVLPNPTLIPSAKNAVNQNRQSLSCLNFDSEVRNRRKLW
jgi:hypothetical protein